MLSVLPTTKHKQTTEEKKMSSHHTNLTQSCDPKYIACVICEKKKKFQKKQFLSIGEDEFLNALKALELLFEYTLLSGVRLQLGFFWKLCFLVILCSSGWWSWWFSAELCPTLVAPQTVACKAPLSVGFSRREYWSGFQWVVCTVYVPQADRHHGENQEAKKTLETLVQ